MAHKWQPIEDLGDSFDESVHDELSYLAEIWREQKQQLNQEQLEIFNVKLKREWSIETGLIERAYDLDRGTTRLLIKNGIREDLIPRHNGNSPDKIAAMLRDHENVINWLFDFVKGDRGLSVSYIKEMHSALLQNQATATGVDIHGTKREIPLSRGQFKTMPNDPVTPSGETHHYCPHEQTASEMDRLIDLHSTHGTRKIPPLAAAAWLHHRFVQIHPFQDGNGRVARCLATLIFIKADWFPLVIRNEARKNYLDALEAADGGNLSPLINLFAVVQKRYFVEALGIIREVTTDTPTEKTLVNSAMQKIKKRNQERMRDHKHAKEIAADLQSYAKNRMDKISTQINNDAQNDEAESWVNSVSNGDAEDYYFRNQIVDVAKELNYFANTNTYRAWMRLVFKTIQRAEILIFFHGIGHDYRGIIACSACFILREQTDDGSQISEPEIITDEVFQINYKEPPEQAQKRFEEWLDKVIPTGLRLWHDSL